VGAFGWLARGLNRFIWDEALIFSEWSAAAYSELPRRMGAERFYCCRAAWWLVLYIAAQR
jgi:hypothetical protein